MIHWQVKFRSLRDNMLYTVSIYDADYSGDPIILRGAARPFETEEDSRDADGMFNDIITQSGYLRIVNNNKDYNGNALANNWWRGMIPETDISRPVILTDDEDNVMWQGFLQAQNFGFQMYVNAQEIKMPIQCAFSTLSRIDMDADAYTGMKNFAALLDYALDLIPIEYDKIYVQGGVDAMQWMIKQFDWRVFGETDQDGVYDSNCSVYDALKNMCVYWGWTLRTHQKSLYLTFVDDTSLPDFWVLTRAQLTTMAGGTPMGTLDTSGYGVVQVYDEFASTDTIDMQMRGRNKASLTSNVGEIEDKMAFLYPDSVLQEMDDGGYSQDATSGIYYTPNKGSFTSKWLSGTMMASSVVNSYFCIRRDSDTKFTPVIKNAAPYRQNEGSFCRFEQLVPNMIADGKFTINFERVDNGERLDRFWFGLTITDAADNTISYSWDGSAWVSSLSYFNTVSGLEISTSSCPITFGYITLYLKGWYDDIIADMSDMELIFSRTQIKGRLFNTGDRESNTYTAKNDAVVKDEWTGDTMFASDNYCKFGPGVVVNPDKTYFIGWNYLTHNNAATVPAKQPGYNPIVLASPSQPEQHLVNRIVNYWSKSRRKIECDLQSNLLPVVTPRHKVTIDGSTMYPVCISQNWRDDVMRLIMYDVSDGQPTPVLPYDAEVEYIEGTGQQYIDTGLKGDSYRKYVIDYQATSKPANPIFGMRNQSSYNGGPIFSFTYSGSNDMVFFAKNGIVVSSNNKLANKRNTNRHTLVLDFKNNVLTIDGISASNILSPGEFVTDYNVFLCSNNVAGTSSTPVPVKMFAYQVYDRNGHLIQDFIPVRVSTVGYMYDRVSGEMHGSESTTVFLAGPDKNT